MNMVHVSAYKICSIALAVTLLSSSSALAVCQPNVPGDWTFQYGINLSTCPTSDTDKSDKNMGLYVGGAVAAVLLGYLIWGRGNENTQHTKSFFAKSLGGYSLENGLPLNDEFLDLASTKFTLNVFGLKPIVGFEGSEISGARFSKNYRQEKFRADKLDFKIDFIKFRMAL